MEAPSDTSAAQWASTASSYSGNVGRTSALAASRLVELVNMKCEIGSGSRVLDNGAGAGAVTFTVASSFPETHVLATDVSSSMLATITACGLPNVTTQVIDARDLSHRLERKSYSHVFSTFMLQTVQNPLAALGEMYEVLSPRGVVGIGIWARRNGPFEIWEQACQTIDPTYKLPNPFDDPNAWRTQQALEFALAKVGFKEVASEEICMPFEFENAGTFIEFWFQSNNPAIVQIMESWEGDLEETRKAVERVIRDFYHGGRDICTWAVLGIGRK
ncbi:MAG: hypothetical protein Q9191_005411 [Dirinaria sp. TL-2023a]